MATATKTRTNGLLKNVWAVAYLIIVIGSYGIIVIGKDFQIQPYSHVLCSLFFLFGWVRTCVAMGEFLRR